MLLSEQRGTEFFGHAEFWVHHALGRVFLLIVMRFGWFSQLVKRIFLKRGVYIPSHASQHTYSGSSSGGAVHIDHRLTSHGSRKQVWPDILSLFWLGVVLDCEGIGSAGGGGEHKALLGLVRGVGVEDGGRADLVSLGSVEVGICHHRCFIDQYNY